ncbi:hypothetical protein [Gilvimarinus sp. DA14]|uniref:hypothetical protein n=1 Tax=Gilvimarinus sp. DA14 TaxID=2956798 RepID=UPI0020B8E92A|nr:hypothetical protein [Gilvimarinus sp. DA14]UTF60208.1 hypothetical protein NHM04_17305 [Gilvimarinus sp. DA14]
MLPAFHPMQKILGLIIWSLYFVFMYGGLSVACNHFSPGADKGALTWINASVILITLLVTLGLLYQAWRGWKVLQHHKHQRAQWRKQQQPQQQDPQQESKKHGPQSETLPPHEFILYVSVAVYCVAAVATLGTGLPALVLAPCL